MNPEFMRSSPLGFPGTAEIAWQQQKARMEYEKFQKLYQTQQTAKPKEPEVSAPNEVLPDISLTRVLKWAVVLLIALALGKKVWNQFGEKITNQVNKALDNVSN